MTSPKLPLLHAADESSDGESLCSSVCEHEAMFDLLACTLPAHGPGTDHVCVGDDGSVLASWSNRTRSLRTDVIPALRRAS